jgi:hypothetical protein
VAGESGLSQDNRDYPEIMSILPVSYRFYQYNLYYTAIIYIIPVSSRFYRYHLYDDGKKGMMTGKKG